MHKILIFDTSVATENLGDLIILDAVQSHLHEMFQNSHFLNTATHDVIGRQTYKLNRRSDFSFVAGTNLLSSNMPMYNQWRINLFDAIFLKDILLVGVGWWQYQSNPNFYTRLLLKKVLGRDFMHSVRDDYALEKLKSIGMTNVINTGCPTTWNLTPEFCKEIPESKSKSVVFTLTDYNMDVDNDRQLILNLKRNYEVVFFWPQGTGDYDYCKSLGAEGIEFLSPSLQAYDELLKNHESLDYVGTRLHAGIRAIQHKRRSIILAVDNRATEKQKDTNLPVVQRDDVNGIENKIRNDWATEIRINQTAISNWKAQFNPVTL